ncbi:MULTISPECIES: enoyl-CoA hydratase/isomerase family protein [Halomonadaceae]|jgi:2-(1,2-epoxy-1,2-dihydrophenyl)acetyl-CoA isomerase|uniref:Enoyl-CoA hydratase/isomerase family protein n=1 Tax=Vreelandella piezotolerans TaxID=2609667 RepID=A0ABQ6X8A9_9GAMM|nr:MULTISPECIES: enoyl-CoA hydratase/isomerase family protein [Halomonas]KAE8438252.1 enoyl-CoA hydratase/isomerase family protein [Halomonas piezotolerans]MCG7577604.1 enoyl-CoA hydratase/isomerase family protein [Halomonas sp. MMH1-48]MCG7591544.1 enoyl-CoA hydratase/isomerase family protein [Halomonas sp. McD50-5]MCG7604669.1 enoyl-CoA hydratase/isomerase family protein [Halomonas sp. MM17-34]MCG7613803.1 enoyl-CoA hydratase/isomerase family protein [Halomonas sp. MM17-29]
MTSEATPLVRVNVSEGGIAELFIARPAVRNALNEPTALALNEGLANVAADPKVRCVILSGEGSAFCAGADVAEFEKATTAPASERLATLFLPALRSMMTMEKPVIAAVSGAAAGIGVSYVLASDMVVMGRSAYLKLAFINIGLIPDGGACWHLVRKLGHAQAFEMAALATPIDAERCVALGLANRAVEDDQVLAEARALAQALVTQSPQALGATKRAMRQAGNLTLDETITLEGELQDACKATEDFHTRVAAFRQRRRK